MSYKIEQKDGNAEVAVTLAWSDLEKTFEQEIKTETERVAKGSDMKGFRKGHVPQDVAQSQVDRMRVLSGVVDGALRDELSAMLEKEKIKVAGSPQVNVTKLAEGNDVEVSVVMAMIPQVELPKEWKKIVGGVNAEHSKKEAEVAVSDEEVDEEISRLAESRTKSEEVDRAAKDGDQVTIDFQVKREGVVIEGGSSTDHNLIIGKGAFIPGFEEEVIGMKASQEKTFTLSFPKEYHAADLAGQEAEFHVTLKKVEERVVPAVDDAFVATLGQTFATVDELKKNMKDGMLSERKKTAAEDRKTAYLEALSDKAEATISPVLIEEELNRMIGEMQQQMAQGGVDFSEYLVRMGKTEEGMREEWKPQALKRIVSAIILERMGEEFEIDPKSEDVQDEMNKTLATYGDMKELEGKIDMQEMYQYTKGIMRNNMVFDELEKIDA